MYVLTPGTGPYAINDSLAQNLSAQSWATVVSPEIFSLGTVDGTPVVIRGVDPSAFLRIEGAEAGPPANLPGSWALAGSGLASRLALQTGTELTLVGSSIPRLDLVALEGSYHTATPADDELLVDYATARVLTGVGAGVFHSIRVETTQPEELLAFLEGRGASAHVTGPGGSAGDANSTPLPADPRVINLVLRFGLGPLPRDYVAEGVREASNSVQVVAWGLEILVLLLVALGIHAVQARAFADTRPTIGVLRALGAPGTWLRVRALRDLLPVAGVAALLGSILGAIVATLLTPTGAIVAFGHEVRVALDPVGILLAAAAIVAVAVVSELALLESSLRRRPAESLAGEVPSGVPPSLEVVLRG